MTVPNHKYSAPLTLDLTLDEKVKALVEGVLDCTTIDQGDDEAARALIGLIGVVADEKNEGTRKMIALDVSAAIYARTEAFYNEVKILSVGARAEYLTPRGTPRNRGKKKLSQAV